MSAAPVIGATPAFETVLLAPLDVTATRGPSLTVNPIESAAAELAATPGGVELVDPARFRRGRMSTVEDIFALSPGVFAQSRFGSDEARISIRGSGLQRTFHGRGVRIVQDGVPLNLADGSFDMQAFEPLAAGHIEVLRGGNALGLGAATLGGAIHYVSRTALDEAAASAELRVEAGSFGYVRGAVADGAARGRLDGRVVVSATHLDGFRAHAEQENQRVFANAGWRATTNLESRFFLTWVNTRSDLPGTLTKAELRQDPRAADPTSAVQDRERNFRLARLANKTAVHVGDTVWEHVLAWTYKDLDHPISPVVDQVTNDVLWALNATHRAGDWLIRGGGSVQRGAIRAANYVNVLGGRGALTARADQTATNFEGFLEVQRYLGRSWTAVAGAVAAENIRESDQLVGATPDYETTFHNVAPRVGLRWDGPRIQVFANVSGSFEPPSFSEALTLNTARRAQRATTVEIGVRGTRGPWRWDTTLYHARIRHELLSLVDPATLQTSTINANRTRHEGIELAGEWDLLGGELEARTGGRTVRARRDPTNADSPAGSRLVLRASWTYGRFTFDDDPRYARNELAGIPPHLIRGELTWENADGWYAGPTFECVPQRTYLDHRNTFPADPYTLVGFRVGRRTRDFAWFLDARNLLERRYAATTGVIENAAGADQRQFLPGDGRALFAGIEIHL